MPSPGRAEREVVEHDVAFLLVAVPEDDWDAFGSAEGYRLLDKFLAGYSHG